MSPTRLEQFVNPPKLAALIPLMAADLLLRRVGAAATIVARIPVLPHPVITSKPHFPICRALRRVLRGTLVVTASMLALMRPGSAQRAPVATRAEHAIESNQAVDGGAVAGSQPLMLTLQLKQSAQQTAALDALLAAQADSASPSYHQWLTPSAYAAQFGATDADLAILTAWLTARGLSVSSISPSRTRVLISGQTASVESAFAVPIHRMAAAGKLYFANAGQATVPVQVAPFIAGITGLDDLPSAASARISLGTGVERVSGSTAPHALASSAAMSANLVRSFTTVSIDPLVQLAAVVDANTTAVLSLTSTACLTDVSTAEIAEYRALLRQASAQGMTVLATSSCTSDIAEQGQVSVETPAFPAALSEVTAITVAPVARAIPAATAADARPVWQAAPGLPADALRHEPDLTTTSAAAFAQTVTTLNQQLGRRVGNLNSTLYSLAKTPTLFTQPAATAGATASETGGAGNWEAATGLGTINLATLLKVYPRGVSSTAVSLTATSYAVNYGDTFTLTAKVVPSVYGTTNPTGTITFTSSTQGVLGSATIDDGGTATLTPDVLPVGIYGVTATYSGDANYSGASTTSKITITISSVNAKLTASLSPSTSVPYGGTATVTVTVSLPGANAAPSGPVSAQILGGTGAVFTATLSPNPGGNTATANIIVSVPSPGSYTVQITCQGTTNYQCQTFVNLPITAVMGRTNVRVSAAPAAPQAGQPIWLTATVSNAGNGTGTYTFNGSVSFYDSGKLLATAPVATNQATTVQAFSGNKIHNITAIYTGDSNWNGSSSGAVAVTPTLLPDTLTLSSNVSSSNSLAGTNIIFTAAATTTITYGHGPTGTLTFFDTYNGAVVQLGGPVTLVANGPTASIGLFTTTGLLPGTHRIYAQYSGDEAYASALSAILVLSLSDFSVTMTPPTLTIAQGKSQQVPVIVGESGGFAGTVVLGCTPPSSSLSTCSFSPASVTGGGATTMTITTTSATAALKSGRVSSVLWTAGTGASLAALLMLILPRRRGRMPSLLTIVFAAATLSTGLGCGVGVSTTASSGSGTATGSNSGSSGSSINNGTPLGTQNYVITAAGSDGGNTIRHTYQYQVTVQ